MTVKELKPKERYRQQGSAVLYAIVATGAMAIGLISFNLFVDNNQKENYINRLKDARTVAFRNLMAMASSTSSLYLSSLRPGANNAKLRACIDRGGGLCLANEFLPIQLYVPFAPGQPPVLVTSNDPAGGDNQGRFTVSGFPSNTCTNIAACAFFGRVFFKGECPNGAASCSQALRIIVRPVIHYRLSPANQFLDWMRQLRLANLPTSAEIASRPQDFEKAIYARDIELAGGAVLCPANSMINGVNAAGMATCTCKTGFTNNNGSATNPDCRPMAKCQDPSVLIGINPDGTPLCYRPAATQYVCWTIYSSGTNNTFDCGANGRMKGAYIADDCLVDSSGIVHCDNVRINCCKPQ